MACDAAAADHYRIRCLLEKFIDVAFQIAVPYLFAGFAVLVEAFGLLSDATFVVAKKAGPWALIPGVVAISIGFFAIKVGDWTLQLATKPCSEFRPTWP